MIEKGFLKERGHKPDRNEVITSILSKVFFFLGLFAVIIALIMIFVNLDKPDYFVWLWLPLVFAGIVMVIVSRLQGKKAGRRG